MFIKGAARFNDLVYFAVNQKDLEAIDIQHSIFIAWDRGEWFQEEHVNWNCIGMCVVQKPLDKLISISEEGDIWTYVGGKKTTENILPEPKSIRNICTIEGYAYACGMNRQVFKRVGEDQWDIMHATLSDNESNKGFEDIDGFSQFDIYAVGWGGEIWNYNGSKWIQADSPTNLILTCVLCAPDGNVYIGGRQGTIIKGKGNQWDLINIEDFTKDIWDFTFFEGKVYFSTMNALYILDESGVSAVDFEDDFPLTCYQLTQAEDTLWSIGTSDVFSFNGNIWTRIE
ncbi:hypothetical protein [Cocleimonas flava]|uniref:hypothetical protein n=1 Tax=Cocleimonas flava TaxID=634765 RepID=UPI0014055059|nr:hypothetical protein [Cocleimonas flava]